MSVFNTIFSKLRMRQLAKLDSQQLRDIGLERRDLFEAKGEGRNVANFLNQRRCERAFRG